MRSIKALGLAENTLIVFTNDNGGPTDENHSSNHPFCGIKGTQLEGGIRVPGIMAWPGQLPAGSVYEFPVSTLDLLPHLTGAKNERPHQTLHWKMETRGAIRDGDWKLLRYPDRPAELYNLADDPGEQNDMAAAHPERVRTLFCQMFAWELELERPLFMLRRAEEGLSARRADEFRKPPSADY